MKILVLGAGIIGITSAWYLNQAGHEVTVIDRQLAPGLETSFANGGQISVSYSEPWANPHAPLKILQWLGRENSPLLFRPRADLNQWLWGLQFLRECLPQRTRFNTTQLIHLSVYSRDTLGELRDQLGLQYQQLQKGILHFFCNQSEFAAARGGFELMRQFGCTIDFLTPDEVVHIEPALQSAKHLIVGGVYAPEDESGDAHQFTQQLAHHAQQQGVQMRFGTTVQALLRNQQQITGVQIQNAQGIAILDADVYVVALGCWSTPLLRRIGLPILVYPAKGYSATLAIKNSAIANLVSLTDHQMKIVFSRLGNQMRIAGTAELNGYELDLNPIRCQALIDRAQQLMPDALDVSQTQFWSGLRPTTPSNIPYIGRTRLNNLWLNTGHGTLGWTHGAGSGKALAQLISGVIPTVDFRFLS